MKWTKEQVIEVLHGNPNFQNFEKEFEGKFICYYPIDGVQVILFNSIGGYAEVFFGACLWGADLESAQEFAEIARNYLQELITKNAYNSK